MQRNYQDWWLSYPATGWIKADQAASYDVLNEVNELRKKNEELQNELREFRENEPQVRDLASLDQVLTVSGRYTSRFGPRRWHVDITWRELFRLLAPHILSHPNDAGVHLTLSKATFNPNQWEGKNPFIDEEVFQTIKVQLVALNLVKTQYSPTTSGGAALFWQLTTKGRLLMMEIATVKADGKSPE